MADGGACLLQAAAHVERCESRHLSFVLDQEFIEARLIKGILIRTMAEAWRHGGTARAKMTWASSGRDCDEACVAWKNSAAWKVQPGQTGQTWYGDGRWWTMRAQ